MSPRETRRFPESDIVALRDRADIAELVGEHVNLRRAGSSWKGLCPFHDENTPSFHVTPSRGTFKCFGCGEGGDVIEWVMRIEALPFPDAVRSLAARVGYDLTENTVTGNTAEQVSLTRRALAVIAATDQWYRDNLDLPEAAHAVAVLAGRGFTREDAETAGCGWARPGGALRDHLHAQGFTDQDALDAGVLVRSDRDSSLYPFLRDRLTWPLHNASGAVVGWGGRRLSEDQQGKYVNSAASPWFDKSSLLYGWGAARKAAASTGRIVVVEGYTDVMAFRRAGVEEVVAACGTAFGATHLRLIERALPEETRIVFCLDGDTAGAKATRKAWEASTRVLQRAEGVTLPGGDPCDVWQTSGAEALVGALSEARPLTMIVLDQVIGAADTGTPDGRARAARGVSALLAEIGDDVLREGYTSWAADRLGVPVRSLTGGGSAPRQDPTSDPGRDGESTTGGSGVGVPAPAGSDMFNQRRIVARLCTSPAGAGTYLGGLEPGLVTDRVAADVLAAVTAAAQDCDPGSLTPAQWVGRICDYAVEDSTRRTVAAVVAHEDQRPDPANDYEVLVLLPLSVQQVRAEAALDQVRSMALESVAQGRADDPLVFLAVEEAQQRVDDAREAVMQARKVK